MDQDIGTILKEWDDEPDAGKIRKIVGSDGTEKIQIRVQFGVLQMELDGRPDGRRPYSKESLLEHCLGLVEAYREEFRTDDGFKLDHRDCQKLWEESLQYYHRYVSLFELKDYDRARRDTARNLQALDLIKEHGESEHDVLSFEKYRPYIVMMNARARAFICMNDGDYRTAIDHVGEAMNVILDFYGEYGFDDDQISESQELAILKVTAKEIREKWESNL